MAYAQTGALTVIIDCDREANMAEVIIRQDVLDARSGEQMQLMPLLIERLMERGIPLSCELMVTVTQKITLSKPGRYIGFRLDSMPGCNIRSLTYNRNVTGNGEQSWADLIVGQVVCAGNANTDIGGMRLVTTGPLVQCLQDSEAVMPDIPLQLDRFNRQR